MSPEKTADSTPEKIEKFFDQKKIKGKIKELQDHYPDTKALMIDYAELDKFEPSLAEELISNPDEVVEIFNQVLLELSQPIFVGDVKVEEPQLHTRFFNLPSERGYLVLVRNITSDYVNKLISVEGLVNKISDVLPKVHVGRFICNRCEETHNVPQPTRFLQEPILCKNCRKRDFRFDPESSQWIDIQRMEVQEPLELLKGGEEARRIEIWLEDDLTDLALPGDKVNITGMVRLRPPKQRGSVYQKFVEANWIEKATSEFEEIEITPEEEKEIKKFSKDPLIYNKIVDSIAPSIYGYKEVKEAIALQMFGGRYSKKMPEGTSIRGDIHVLLIGDPGVAKSRILQYVDEIAPKSLYVTGKGATGAGLTATAEKDEFAEGAWTLKAGALVLAGGGICAIDEFDKMREEDRSAIHEALEQQSYHPSTEIMLANGKTTKIEELVDNLIQKNEKRVIKGKDCEILPVHDLEVLTTDFHNIFPIKANRVSRHLAPDNFIRITYGNGRSILVTPEHPVYVFRDKITTIRADQVLEGNIGLAPRFHPTLSKNLELKTPHLEHKFRDISFPKNVNKKFGRLLGYLITEGHSYYNPKHGYAEIGISNTNHSLINESETLFRNIFSIPTNINIRRASSTKKATKDLMTVRCSSQPLYKFFELNFKEMLGKAPLKRAPNAIKTSSNYIQKEFLRTAFKGDGFIDSERFGFSTSSVELAKDYQDLLLQQRIWSYIAAHNAHYKVVISGDGSMNKFLRHITERDDRRRKRIQEFGQRSQQKLNYRDSLPPKLVKEVDSLLKDYRLSDGYFTDIIKNQHNSHRKVVKRYLDKVAKRVNKAKVALSSNSPKKIRKKLYLSLEKVAEVMSLSISMITYLERNPHSKRSKELLYTVRKLGEEKLNKTIQQYTKLKNIVNSDICFIKIKKVELTPNDGVKWVYDVTVEPNHNFISEGLILHNTISIAKAGIVTKFKANTSVLAAANPKFSRFDLYKPLGEQFDIPPTLISRFDLIFPVRDILDKEKDRKIAEHMLKIHRGEKEMEELQPEISPDLFRKYVAYARKNIHPILSDDAAEKIRDYYVELRGKGSSEKVASATPRQLEALVRLAEASAKIRLSDVATISDAERAINLTNFVLKEIATDESGRIDIDRIAAEYPKSTRDKVMIIEKVIKDLVLESGDNTASHDDIITEAIAEGVDRFKAEQFITELKRKGIIFEPKHGKFMLTEE